ncbi:hypothetical protein ACFFX1_26560 [Dactylosporangium sucinum]|uniref:Uncharacterized protein n=1 Tax=Dactylosporangium sucinum TaxID=1424081 RepID=A0A917T221_9ACTN|nr:hypothetical protein [Dactylosporangium sucinum]GGM05511.1 hypothetical protein GCM10007977_003300 [Dactylosporangium sucinum]
MEHWRSLWRAAPPQPRRPVPATDQPAAAVVIGRPPTDAAALRERPRLAAAIDAALGGGDVRQVLLAGPGGAGKSQLAAAAFHRARGRTKLWVPAASRPAVLAAYARAWRAIAAADGPDGGLQPVVEEVFGRAHRRPLRTRHQRAELRHRGGDERGAVADAATVLAEMRDVQGDDHPRTRELADLLARWTV